MKNFIVGIDVGGTTIKNGIIDLEGNIVHKWEIPTNKANSGQSILADIWDSVHAKLKTMGLNNELILGIGIGAPGFIDKANGVVYEAVNIGWRNIKVVKKLEELSGIPVFAENDANMAVLGENWKGAGDEAINVIAITLGTGVGGGIIANGNILSGENGTAGEIGHTTAEPNGEKCNCGRKGCLETIVSATGIVRQALSKIEENPVSPLADFYRRNPEMTAKDIFTLAVNGDLLCQAVIEHTADVLGLAIANIATVINPSKIIIGGGVSAAGKDFLARVDSSFRTYALKRVSDVCELKVAQLGNDAGIIGAAFLVKQHQEGVTF